MITIPKNKLIMARYLIVLTILVLLSIGNAHAAGTDIPVNGLMDELLNLITKKNATYQLVFAPAAKSLYAGLVTLEIAFDTGERMLKEGGPMKVIGILLVRISVMLIWFAMIDNPDWVQQIIEQAKSLAGSAGGINTSKTTPSSIAGMGVDLFSGLMEKVKDQSFSFTDPKLILFGLIIIIVGLAVIVLFVLTGLMYFITQVESSMVLSVGILMLGFLGSSWTKQWGQAFMAYIVAVCIKLIVTLILISLIQTVTTTWAGKITSAPEFGDLLNVAIYICLGAGILLFLVMNIPAIAAGIVTGVSTASIGGAMAAGGAIMAAGAMVAAGAGALASGGKKLASGGGSSPDSGPSGGDSSGGGDSAQPDSSMGSDGASSPEAPGGNSTSEPQGGISGGDLPNQVSGDKQSNTPSGNSLGDKTKSLASSAYRHLQSTEGSTSVAPPAMSSKHSEF